MSVANTETLLLASLEVAVPLWQEKVRGWTDAYRKERAEEASQFVAEHGDNVLYRGKKPGQSAEAFNRLAEGLAILSFAPGGVKFLGRRWEA